jgi:DNA-binding beta-propeller fold protein YncE
VGRPATALAGTLTPETVVITVTDHKIVGKVAQTSPLCLNIPATPDRTGLVQLERHRQSPGLRCATTRFYHSLLKTLDTGPITHHVNIVRNANGMFAYVTVGGLNEIEVLRTDDFSKVATIPTGKLRHGIWPSGDGTRAYVGLENDDKIAVLDTVGQASQALVYVANAIPTASGGWRCGNGSDAGRA